MNKKFTGRGARSIERELETLRKMPDSEIDTSDIPVLPPEEVAKGGYRQILSSHQEADIDADVLAWLKQQGPGYQG